MRSWLAASGLVLLLASTSVASAQPSAADLRTARGLFRDGVAAGEADRWEDALDLFERAHALSQRADVLLNVAAAQVELGRRAEAAATYRRFQAEADAAMLEQHGAAVESALAELEPAPPPEPPQADVAPPVVAQPVMVLDPAVLSAPPEPRHRDDSTLAIVLGVVGGAIVVGTAIALGVVFGSPSDAPSYQGTVYPYSIDVQ